MGAILPLIHRTVVHAASHVRGHCIHLYGNDFNTFDYANTSYSTSDFIRVSFDLAVPLVANLIQCPMASRP